jgi:hypothetical protein
MAAVMVGAVATAFAHLVGVAVARWVGAAGGARPATGRRAGAERRVLLDCEEGLPADLACACSSRCLRYALKAPGKAAQKANREADRVEAEAWSVRMEGHGGHAR